MIPQLIDILTPPQGSSEFDETEFVSASDALQEIMSKSALSGGSGSRTLTEPLLLWFDRYGGAIVDNTLRGEFDAARAFHPCIDLRRKRASPTACPTRIASSLFVNISRLPFPPAADIPHHDTDITTPGQATGTVYAPTLTLRVLVDCIPGAVLSAAPRTLVVHHSCPTSL